MNGATLLLRQAHPQFAPEGKITSQVFMPFPKDEGLLSVDDGDQISAAEAFAYYANVLGLQSNGVWSVSKGEADSQSVPGIPFPEPGRLSHANIDFRGKSENECRKIAKKLKASAVARGCLYQPAN